MFASAATVEILKSMQADPAEFRNRLVIDAGSGTRRYGESLDWWQAQDFAATDAGWKRAIGLPLSEGDVIRQRAYLERGRGHSKTTDNAVMATWALFAAQRKVTGSAAAASKDQAGFLRDAIDSLLRLNLWLKVFIDVQDYVVKNRRTGSEFNILAADESTNYGENPDFLICDELTHWKGDKGKGLWSAMFSAAGKRENCMAVVITNAGSSRGKSWQWQIRETARQHNGWYFHSLDGPQASWISGVTLAEQREFLPPSAYNRLWLNQWQTGEGDALDPNAIEACVTLESKRQAEAGCIEFVAGLDLGVKHDHAALVVLGLDPERMRLRLCECLSWAPSPITGKVDLPAVRDAVRSVDARFGNGLAACYFDPHQAALMEQELGLEGVNMVEVNFYGRSLSDMAATMLSVFESRAIDLYRDGKLLADLSRLTIVEKSYGYKLESISDEHGHADRAIALAIALPRAVQFLRELRRVVDSRTQEPVEYYA